MTDIRDVGVLCIRVAPFDHTPYDYFVQHEGSMDNVNKWCTRFPIFMKSLNIQGFAET